ncbi:nematoblast specific protein, putative [Ichthyophthirius multifiliis]|uniref:Nematoblast specific protein, putative n=1 Tax=Ichthyophthirius multifiliis TaxID=5932 RepID=G0QKG6_ICHMU|nr:nematoblast specific protein, putative [Ichthyophthirius multifiliis]EGR34288.1 nematoblast specific protein, putative [Ichthyophthirius multifiliis]|eukprot:XP_004039592.1 nematoblast specific protein, putative [Ichthyophthirius multifiliis]
MKISLILLTLSLFYLIVPTCQQEEVAFGWNSFLTSPRQNNNPRISEKGVQNWSTQQQIIRNYPTLTSLLVSGSNLDLNYVKKSFSSHFGRRGPSVHFTYEEPIKEIEWFYNEVFVPKGNDQIGTYAMAIGFAQGYFGIQVNSQTERRILFSVWSNQYNDNPNEIMPDNKVICLQKGNDVVVREFGGEGSGGQSYMIYPWKVDVTYKFWLRAQPQADNKTNFTAYFYDPDTLKWLLIASFQRNYTNTYIKRPHSFLENFSPEYGHLKRKVYFGNQWAIPKSQPGQVAVPAKSRFAIFTTDSTGSNKMRLDLNGGNEGNYLFLENCGFSFDGRNLIKSYKMYHDKHFNSQNIAPDKPDQDVQNLNNNKKLRNLIE